VRAYDSILLPYAVYDVSKGQERLSRGKSVENEQEAFMAVALYGELRRIGEAAARRAAAAAAEPPGRLEVCHALAA